MPQSASKRKPPEKPQAERLLAWYDRHRRVLPWRALPGEKANPYRVWLSEIMLQQTTVVTVGPYFEKFIRRWPRVTDLAKASLAEVRQMWAGLGYYRRAEGLWRAAQAVAADLGGVFPAEEEALRALPGIGPYTSAAIAAIAFDKRANVVDGNVERVVARLFALAEPLPTGKAEIRRRAESLLPQARYADYAQAMMDLGATVCTPRSPSCALCPLCEACAARKQGNPEEYPARTRAKPKPVRRAIAFVAFDPKRGVLLRERPAGGLLGGMTEVPSSPWVEAPMPTLAKALPSAPLPKAAWRLLPGGVRHVFTHFELELKVAFAPSSAKGEGRWVALESLEGEALPSVMRKILRHAFEQAKAEEE